MYGKELNREYMFRSKRIKEKDAEIERLKDEVNTLKESLKTEYENARNLYGRNRSMALEIEILKRELKEEKEKNR